MDSNVEYSLFKNEKEISKMNAMLDSNRLSNTIGLENRLAQLLHINRGLRRKLYVSLYKDGEFPTGLLPNVLNILKEEQYIINDARKRPQLKQHKFVLKEPFPALRHYQKTGTKALEENERGVVVMPTGTGKSLLVAKMIWDLGVNTLIITPSKAITDHMQNTLIKHFGKGKVDKLNTKTVKIKKPINIVNIQALVKMKPSALKNIDAVFTDEFHHSSAETFREVNLKHLKDVYFRIGVTATNFRNDGSDLALQSVLSNVLFEYSIPQAIKEGYLIKPEFEFIQTQVQDAGNWQQTYKSAIVENDDRNEIIAKVAIEEAQKGRHVIILVQQIEHGERLQKLIKSDNAKFIHGTIKDLEREKLMEDFRKGKINILIGSTVIGEGVDLPIADTLIMAGGGKARSQVMQNVGRVLRVFPGKKSALIIDFTDEGSRWLEEHSILREEVYSIYN